MKIDDLFHQACQNNPLLAEYRAALEAVLHNSTYTILGKCVSRDDAGKLRAEIDRFERLAMLSAGQIRERLIDGFIAASTPEGLQAIRQAVAEEPGLKSWLCASPKRLNDFFKLDPATQPAVRAKIFSLIPAPASVARPVMRMAEGY